MSNSLLQRDIKIVLDFESPSQKIVAVTMEISVNRESDWAAFDYNIKLARSIKKHDCKVALIPQEFHPQTSPHQVQTAMLLIKEQPLSQDLAPRQAQLASQVLQRVFRALENFLIHVLQQPFRRISSESLELLMPWLLNSRQQLPEQQRTTFLCFLKGTYGLGIHYSSEYFGAKLESFWMSSLKQLPKTVLKEPLCPIDSQGSRKIKVVSMVKKGKEGKSALQEKSQINKNLFKRQTETDKLNQVWDHKMEVRLLCWVQDNEFFLKIRDELRKEFPQHQEIITTQSLKNRYYKVLRTALKQLKLLQDQNPRIPQMEHLSDSHVKYILRSSEGHEARRQLIRLYTLPKGSGNQIQLQVSLAIESINNCLD